MVCSKTYANPTTLTLLLSPVVSPQRMSNEESLAETEARYSEQLAELQRTVNNLELQLYHIHTDITSNNREYDILLDLKNHLETEITEYRLLLEGENR